MLKEETKAKLSEKMFGAAYFHEIMDAGTRVSPDEWALLKALDALFGNTPEIDGQMKFIADACAQALLGGYEFSGSDGVLDITAALALEEAAATIDVVAMD